MIAGIVVAALIAAAFIGWGLWQSAEYEREANYHAREYAAYTDQQIRKTCLSRSPAHKQGCAAKARHEQRDNERNERDLVAQRQSALWAYIMGAAAVIGMGLSVIGVFLVWTTFAETRTANDIARQAAYSASADAKRSRDALISSDRAVLFITQAIQDMPIEPGGLRTTVHLRLENRGKSTAYGIQIKLNSQMEPLWNHRTRFTYNVDQICAAGGTILYAFNIRTPKKFPRYLIGYVAYSTMGDDQFRSYFCYRIDGAATEVESGDVINTYLEKAHCQRMPTMR